MRDRKKILIISVVLFAVVLVLGLINFYVYLHRDTILPTFSYDNETIILTKKQKKSLEEGDQTILLEGIHAMDNVDGDLTDKIIIHDVKIMYEGLYMTVIYRVVDSSDNLANGYRIVYFKSPKEVENAVLIAYMGYNPFEKEADKKNTQSTEKDAEDQESNEETISDEKTTSKDGKPVFTFKDEVTISAGDEFDLADQVITCMDDKDTIDQLRENIVILGNYDANTPGTYIIVGYVKDSDGNYSETTTLKLTVQ